MARKKDEAKVDTRGQITVPLDGYDYVLRPSYEAIASIERQLKPRGLYDLSAEASTGRLAVEDMGIIVAEMMHAHGKAAPEDPLVSTYRSATAERMGELIYEAGGAFIMQRILRVLVAALVGGYNSKGEPKATGTK